MRWLNTGFVEGFVAHIGGKTVKSTDRNITETGTYISVSKDYIQKNIEATNEIWFSFDMALKGIYEGYGEIYLGCTNLPHLRCSGNWVAMFKVYDEKNNVLYNPQISFDFSDGKKHNIELHIKTGDTGRLDVWFDHKLMFSYRSPSAFTNPISFIQCGANGGTLSPTLSLSSFILQDTRRIDSDYVSSFD